MLRSFAQTLFPLLCAFCLSAFSQESAVVRVCVALPATVPPVVSSIEVRDAIAKVLNDPKLDKKLNITLQVVALDALPGQRAMAEARQESCGYVLYSDLKRLEASYEFERTGDGSVTNTPVAIARMEYLVKRLSDGATYAAGTGKSDASISNREAILQAVARAGRDMLSDLSKGGNVTPNTLTAADSLEKMVPTLNADAFTGANFCAWLPSETEHADALRGACEYAMTLPQKMPNFICHQETARYQGRNKVPTDLITASVRYENGEESYSDLQLNGKAVSEATARTAGLWSGGQFAGDLRDIFHRGNQAVFEFAGERQVGDRTAWVFTYRIGRQNEPLWQLRAEDKILAPPYGGQLWVDAKSGDVVRFESAARNLPSSFPMQSAEVLIDYDNVAFGDGTAFVLPVASTIGTRFQGFEATRNVVQFRGCHKFRATTRMIVNVADAGEKSPDAAGAGELRKNELEEDETIYVILREQAIREDAEQLTNEQERDLKWAAIGAMSRLAALEKERQKNEDRLAANENHLAPGTVASSEKEPVTTFKASVNLVPVSVVVRDGKGHAVGNLKKSDFQLFDERRPQAIGSFSLEVRPGAQVSSATQQESGASAARVVDGEQEQIENNVAYVFDDIHSSFEDIENAQDAALRHVGEMRPEDHAAVFTTSGAVSLNFTGDREKVQSALHALKSQQRSTAADCPQLSYYMADMIVNQGDGDATAKAIAEALECNFHHMGKGDAAEAEMARQLTMAKAFEILSTGRVESENTLSVLQEVITTTAGMPGKRSVVLVSPGFLVVDPHAQDKAMALIDRAVEAGVIINTLDVRGVLTTSVSATALDLANNGQFDRQEATARSAVMADFAYGTGGVFFHNNNDLDLGFRQTADVPRFIYVLGFSPQKLDGKIHKLKVKLTNGEKLTVQARAGYYAARP